MRNKERKRERKNVSTGQTVSRHQRRPAIAEHFGHVHHGILRSSAYTIARNVRVRARETAFRVLRLAIRNQQEKEHLLFETSSCSVLVGGGVCVHAL